jgi:hypothetical protein
MCNCTSGMTNDGSTPIGSVSWNRWPRWFRGKPGNDAGVLDWIAISIRGCVVTVPRCQREVHLPASISVQEIDPPLLAVDTMHPVCILKKTIWSTSKKHISDDICLAKSVSVVSLRNREVIVAGALNQGVGVQAKLGGTGSDSAIHSASGRAGKAVARAVRAVTLVHNHGMLPLVTLGEAFDCGEPGPGCVVRGSERRGIPNLDPRRAALLRVRPRRRLGRLSIAPLKRFRCVVRLWNSQSIHCIAYHPRRSRRSRVHVRTNHNNHREQAFYPP